MSRRAGSGTRSRARPATLTLEHLVYTWAPRTLDGRGGFGVLATSAGWDVPETDAGGPLAPLLDFLPEGSTNLLRQGVSAPHAMLCAPVAAGTLIARKTTLPMGTAMSRPGNYLVHALLDRSGALGPAHALGLWDTDMPWRAVPEELTAPTRELPSLTVDLRALPRRPEPAADLHPDALAEHLPVLIEAALGVLRSGQRFLISAPDSATGAAVLAHLYALLPLPLAAELSMSTFEADPARATTRLAVLHPQFRARSVPRDAMLFDLDAPERSRLPEPGAVEQQIAGTLAGLYLSDALPEDLDSAASVEDLTRVLRLTALKRRPGTSLTAQDVAALIRADPAWLDEPSSRGVLLNRAATNDAVLNAAIRRLPAAQAQALANDAATRLVESRVRGDRVAAAALTDVLRQLRVSDPEQDAATLRALLSWLDAGQLDRSGLALSWPAALACQAELDAANADRLLVVALSNAIPITSMPWGPLCAAAIRRYLSDPTDGHRRALGDLVVEHAEQLPDVVDELLETGVQLDVVEEALGAVLSALALVDVLLAARKVPTGSILLDTLPWLREQDRYEILRERWPQLAAQAGIPEPVSRLLTPTEPVSGDVLPAKKGLLRRGRR